MFIRETRIKHVWGACLLATFMIACESDPSFEIEEEAAVAETESNSGDVTVGSASIPQSNDPCTTDEGELCENDPNYNNGGDDAGGSDDGSSGGSDGGSGDDGGSSDGGSSDAGSTDGGSTDSGSTDGGMTDGGSTDSGSTDGGMTDGGSTDSGSTDGGSTDGGSTDGGSTDGGSTDGTLQGYEEDFSVNTNPKPVDLVLTVDNSGSMSQEQVGLADRIVSAFSHIKQADYRVVLISTDVNDGIAFIADKNDPGTFEDKMAALASAITGLGTSGSGNEQGNKQTINALLADHPNDPGNMWIRPDSVVASIIVSDEDNCSTGGCAENDQWMINQLQAAPINRTAGDTARVYGLIRRAEGECPQAYNVGNVYMDLINATNGLAGAICDADYGPTLQQVSADIGVIADSTFETAHAPYPGTVQAWINSAPYVGNIEVDANRVTLTDATLTAGDQVHLTYSYMVP